MKEATHNSTPAPLPSAPTLIHFLYFLSIGLAGPRNSWIYEWMKGCGVWVGCLLFLLNGMKAISPSWMKLVNEWRESSAMKWKRKEKSNQQEPQRRLSGRVGLSFLCGLRAGPPAIAPHKEDKHSPATLPFNKFILSFFFFLARRAWTVLVVGYGWGPALCRGRTQSNWFHQFPLSSLPSFVSLKKKERVDWLINKRKDEREWNDCLWDESWRAIQP